MHSLTVAVKLIFFYSAQPDGSCNHFKFSNSAQSDGSCNYDKFSNSAQSGGGCNKNHIRVICLSATGQMVVNSRLR